MARIDITRTIAAPPEAVWAVLEDIEHQGQWMVDVRKLKVVSRQKSGAGTIMHVTSTLFGLPVVRDVMEITAWEPPERMDIVHRGQFHGSGSFVLSAAAHGVTEFRWIEEFRPPLGRLGELVFALIVRPHLIRTFARSMANVRRIAEARTAA